MCAFFINSVVVACSKCPDLLAAEVARAVEEEARTWDLTPYYEPPKPKKTYKKEELAEDEEWETDSEEDGEKEEEVKRKRTFVAVFKINWWHRRLNYSLKFPDVSSLHLYRTE